MDDTVVVTAAILSLALLPWAWNASRPPGRAVPHRLAGPTTCLPATCPAPLMHHRRPRPVGRVEHAVRSRPCKRPVRR